MAETRDAIIKMGDELIRQKGYNAFSYSAIAEPLGIKNAAVHYHFPTKTHLLTAIVQYHIEKFKNFEKNVAPLNEYSKVEAFVDTYVKIEAEHRVCFVGAMATDWDTLDAAVKPYTQQMAGYILEWMITTLQTGKENGVLYFDEQPRTKALLIISNLLAATQLARITGSESFNTIKNAVLSSINLTK